MANTVAMRAPTGFTGSVSCTKSTPPNSGQTYTPDSKGMILADPRDVGDLLTAGFLPMTAPTLDSITTADSGATQTLPASAMVGGDEVFHNTSGGSTPSLTLPLAADVIAARKMQVGDTFGFRLINANSGIATVVTNTGWTTSGTLTVANGTWRDFVVEMTAAGALKITSVGTGTNS